MTVATEVRFPQDAPYFDGHFPGHPLVPAVVILDLVRACAPAEWAREPLQFAKFVAPVRPGDVLTIEVERSGAAHTFRCRVDARQVAFGAFGRLHP